MGPVQSPERLRAEIDEIRREPLSCPEVRTSKEGDEFGDEFGLRPAGAMVDEGNREDRLVCVTSGRSYLGRAIVNRLLLRGYSVRLVITKEEEGREEELRETESWGPRNNGISVVVVEKLSDAEGLSEAFNGCSCVLHTAAFIDPAGLSGYTKSMAEIEAKACENVMVACARTASVRNCVLTSSLLACIWRDTSQGDLSTIVNHHCWSDESVCLDKKLWYALGKLRAEKAAWRIAHQQRRFKLVTICPALITGPQFSLKNPTPTIAYLKGFQEMFADGLLATVDVHRLAEAHVGVLEAMNKGGSFGRYVCFDRVIRRQDEAEILAGETGMQMNPPPVGDDASGRNHLFRFELSNVKLSGLLSRTQRCSDPCHVN